MAKKSEPKYFGGLHGGHVTIEVDSIDYGFEPANGFHVIAHRKNFKSDFVARKAPVPRYGEGSKMTTILIPLTAQQYALINEVHACYCANTPYDYAFFGMRCAASAEHILEIIGLSKPKGITSTILTTFYPKKLRKRLLKLASRNHYQVIRQEGRQTRVWEKD
ncbi:MAG: hypothetical protein JST26_01315 [Bacteroidetes bacterium]|nr:hypothetical protein [Bacteroidota bacterium]